MGNVLEEDDTYLLHMHLVWALRAYTTAQEVWETMEECFPEYTRKEIRDRCIPLMDNLGG